MYYQVREGFKFTSLESEGFCKNLRITSQMFDGEAIIDGWYRTPFNFGDFCTLESDARYALRVVCLSSKF